ncbi:GNAT family N-acetyltransferase [Photorhabdus noenieputensis]|uniref:GNAT family N-acetyltransferase n=1 Tax=Photorhabdus noenieputensis TaxID=1208607 RepID=UPI001BD1E062|nr:GNAT family N-acetyltransferase [Photorhabdus noenieputensis]MBS9436839.1 GNAT family N-acetyltransferase [Photorhabdus noenieputensis]MCK3671576.1 GNAT family N-acetyltransferase [Photorhabdus noenieputensis]
MKHIVIRHVEEGDCEQVRQLYANPQVYCGTLQLPYPSLEAWIKRITNLSAGCFCLVACIDGKIVGQIGIEIYQNLRRRHVATFGMGVHADYQGQGIGSELMEAMLDMCDGWLNIERIELEVYTDNDAAIALYKKFGFEIEGMAKHYAFRNGRYADAYYMSRISDISGKCQSTLDS